MKEEEPGGKETDGEFVTTWVLREEPVTGKGTRHRSIIRDDESTKLDSEVKKECCVTESLCTTFSGSRSVP